MKPIAVVLTMMAAIIGAALIPRTAPSTGEIAVGLALMAPAMLLGLGLLWRTAAWLELLVAWPFEWREAVNRLEFDRFVATRATGARQPPPPRLSFVQRLQAIRPALRLQSAEVARRERPPRTRPFKPVRQMRLRLGKLQVSGWRLLWFGAWVLFAILRAVHAFSQ